MDKFTWGEDGKYRWSHGDVPSLVRDLWTDKLQAYGNVRGWIEGFLEDGTGSLSAVHPTQPVLEMYTKEGSCTWNDYNRVISGKPHIARLQMLANGEVLWVDGKDAYTHILLGALEEGADVPQFFENRSMGSLEQLTPWLSEGKRPVLYSYSAGPFSQGSTISVYPPIQTIEHIEPAAVPEPEELKD